MKFKNIVSYLAVAVVMCFVVSAAVYSGTITKGKLTKSDIALWTGTSSTEWERETSTGYSLTLPYFDYMGVDVLETYGGNINANDTTLQLALDAIETTNERLIWMAPTTWDIDDDVTIPANVTMQCPPGCTLAIANTKDLYFSEDGRQIQAGNYQIFDTTAGGTVTIASAIMEHDMWRDGTGLDWYPSSDAAIDLGASSNEFKDVYVDGKAYIDGLNFNGTDITSTASELNILTGVTATAAELNQCDGVGLIVGDTTAGRVLRSSVLTIDDATDANEIECQLTSLWNGDAIAATDNIGKGELVGDFRLGATGSVITIETNGLIGNCVAVFSVDIYENKTNAAILIKASHNVNDIRLEILDSLLGTAEDMTSLVDTGRLQLSILYLADS